MLRSFSKSTGVAKLIKRQRYWSNAAKYKRIKKKCLRFTVIALTTIFATMKNPNKFVDRKNFEIGAILAVVNNCTTVMVLNESHYL